MVRGISSVKTNIQPTKLVTNKAKKITPQIPTMFLKTKEGATVMTTGALAMILPASSFLDKTKEPMSMNHVINENGQYYEVHYPQDDSDYYWKRPCENPNPPSRYIPLS